MVKTHLQLQIILVSTVFSLRSLLHSERNTFPENVVIFSAQIIICHMLITGSKKLCGVFGWNIALEKGRKLALKRKNRRKNILVFLFKGLKARWIDALSLFFLIGIGFTCKKNFRKTSQRLLGRKPRRFLWSTNVIDNSSFRLFPGISQNLPGKCFHFFR